MAAKRTDTLAFLPAPAIGHLVPAKELIKLLLHRHDDLLITVIILDNRPFELDLVTSFIHSLSQLSNPRLHFIHLRLDDTAIATATPGLFPILDLIYFHRRQLREALLSIASSSRLVSLVLDLFCSSVIDIAQDLCIPPYIFATSSTISLSYVTFFHDLSGSHHRQDIPQYLDNLIKSNTLISFSTFREPVPARLLSPSMNEKSMLDFFLRLKETIRTAKGMLLNSFAELEAYALKSLSDIGMPVYPVGPLVCVDSADGKKKEEEVKVMGWLDRQPLRSVVFLSFGSMGNFTDAQVKELAAGLERSKQRFLWSLRRTDGGGEVGDILPEGFLERTGEVGKVIGWAPQAAVLAHRAVGGFVSHCGWNSTLESLRNGVPMATWPLYGEQHVNAYFLARVVGVAVELSMDHSVSDGGELVTAEVVEKGVRELMEDGGGARKKMAAALAEEMKETTAEAGSSLVALGRFLQDLTLQT